MTDGLRPNPSETADEVVSRFRDWFWRPPRRHGEVLQDRTVTFLELFYDLVYVVVIAQAAHHLAAHVSLEATIQFAIIFGLIWVAWINGSLYHELHGRQDGRTRSFVFIQMALLALLAVFTADAASGTGTEFALVYSAFLVVMAWLWYSVRRIDDDRYDRVTGVYLMGMAVTITAMVVSAFLPDDLRLPGRRRGSGARDRLAAAHAMAAGVTGRPRAQRDLALRHQPLAGGRWRLAAAAADLAPVRPRGLGARGD